MRKIILWFTGVFLSISGFSQVTADFGIWGGVSGYTGDIEENTITQASFPTLGAFYRHNFNQRVSARAMFLMGKVAAEGVFQNNPAWSFDKTVQDFSLQAEINFLRYMVGNKRTPFTSYVTAGIGAIHYPYEMDPAVIAAFNPNHIKGDEPVNQSVVALTLPFGMGFKFSLWEKLGFGIEYQMRKIFDDRLDNLDDPLAHYNVEGNEVKYTDFMHNNDWTGYLGLQLTYNFYIGSKACPAYDKKK